MSSKLKLWTFLDTLFFALAMFLSFRDLRLVQASLVSETPASSVLSGWLQIIPVLDFVFVLCTIPAFISFKRRKLSFEMGQPLIIWFGLAVYTGLGLAGAGWKPLANAELVTMTVVSIYSVILFVRSLYRLGRTEKQT